MFHKSIAFSWWQFTVSSLWHGIVTSRWLRIKSCRTWTMAGWLTSVSVMASGTGISSSSLYVSSFELEICSAGSAPLTDSLLRERVGVGDRRWEDAGKVITGLGMRDWFTGPKFTILKIWHSPQSKIAKKRIVTPLSCVNYIDTWLPYETLALHNMSLTPVRKNRPCRWRGSQCLISQRPAVFSLRDTQFTDAVPLEQQSARRTYIPRRPDVAASGLFTNQKRLFPR